MTKSAVRIVLVRPEEAGNVGAVARVMKNFGLGHLVLVDPRLRNPKDAYKWAHGAEEVVEGADLVSTLEDAVAPCSWAWAVTRRRGKIRGGASPPRTAAGKGGEGVAWVFGPESTGLSLEEVSLCSGVVTIPTAPSQPSLNLAQAVAVCVYELYQAALEPGDGGSHREAPLEERNAMYRHLEESLLKIGFLLPHTARTRMAALRRSLERSRLKPSEVRLWRGVARQVGWAADRMDTGSGPGEEGSEDT